MRILNMNLDDLHLNMKDTGSYNCLILRNTPARVPGVVYFTNKSGSALDLVNDSIFESNCWDLVENTKKGYITFVRSSGRKRDDYVCVWASYFSYDGVTLIDSPYFICTPDEWQKARIIAMGEVKPFPNGHMAINCFVLISSSAYYGVNHDIYSCKTGNYVTQKIVGRNRYDVADLFLRVCGN